MITASRRRLALISLCPALLPLVLLAACGRSEDKTATPDAVQDTMLLHDLAQANRNTAIADMDTTIPVIVRSRPTDGEVQEIPGVGGSPENARQILTPSAGTPRVPRRPPVQPAPPQSLGDPCESPAAEDQRTCLNRSIARADVALNRTYQELIAQARTSGGSELEERFRQQQRTWIITRDDECRNMTRSQEGTLWAKLRGQCLADYSAKRTGELQASLNRLRGL